MAIVWIIYRNIQRYNRFTLTVCVRLSVMLCDSLSACPSIRQSVCVCPSVCLCQSVSLCVRLSDMLSVCVCLWRARHFILASASFIFIAASVCGCMCACVSVRMHNYHLSQCVFCCYVHTMLPCVRSYCVVVMFVQCYRAYVLIELLKRIKIINLICYVYFIIA